MTVAEMRRTRLSLIYVAGYLILAGVMLMLAPKTTIQLFQSNSQYGEVMPRLLGVVLFALGVVVVQIIRHAVENLYSTTILVRLFILAALAALYVTSNDPLFVVLLGVVGLGVLLTGTSYLLDRRTLAAGKVERMAPKS